MEGIVSFVVEQLGNLIKDEMGLLIDVKKEVEKLHSKFTAIRAGLGKAEKKQFTDETVRDWLRKIKEVAYEVEDMLDEWRTDAFLSQRDKDDIGNQRTVGISSFIQRPFFKRLKLCHETGQRIRELTERLDGISKEKIDFSWNEDHNIDEVELMSKMKARETGSLIDESRILGRDPDKKIIINELISDNNREQKSVSIISIVGMGGLGKTTLAQLVFNDESVKTHFEKKIWVCVSDPFDVSKIANKVVKSLSRSNLENSDLDTLQHSLREAVSKMPFLLVLDDVWNEDKTLWEKLRVPLLGAAQGSKILVTTRSRKAAEVMETTHFHDLEHLSHSDCLNLFKSIAFKGAEAEEFAELTKVGEDIVWRCKGLPLAVQVVGSLLGCRRTYGYWKHILDSRIWEWDYDILPALLLSYYSLPFHLKRCFSFCSLFPKDYVMEKDKLVKLWMAHGLIESKNADIEVDMEEIGEMYFDDLLARSLFQDAEKDKLRNMSMCKMHDLVHDLATRVADGDYRYMENEDFPPTNCHHLSLHLNRDVSSIPSSVCEATRLRTLLFIHPHGMLRYEPPKNKAIPGSSIPDSLFNHLRFLRALDLRKTSIENLLSAISKLKHLRYLNLSGSVIKELPESVTDLCNLQTLKLDGCRSLCMLPSGMSKMVQLRHLEIEGTRNLAFLPDGLGNLTTLRTLSKFPVRDKNRGCKIGELKNLNLLRGELTILNLERVLNVNEAREAQLNKKSYLQTLCLYYEEKTDEEWSMLGDVEMERMEGVFGGLGPLHPNLKKLEIVNYVGSKFSSWLEDFQSLTEVSLENCRKLRLLPSLGNLCSLKSLKVVGADEVKVVGDEFCGNGSGRGRVFPKLESLSFKEMENWEEWKLTDEYGEVMPSLKTLNIDRCYKLKAMPDRLPCNLREVSVDCEQVTWMPCDALPLLECLSLRGQVKVELSPFPALKTLKISHAPNEKLPYDRWALLESLHEISIYYCPRLVLLPDGFEQLKSLRSLSINDCPQLRHFPPLQHLTTLELLYISECPLVEEQLEKEIEEDRCSVSHICKIYIGYKRIQ